MSYPNNDKDTGFYADDLEHDGLYIMLFLRTDQPVKDDFHWALYVHNQPQNRGIKYHIRTEGSSTGWVADHATLTGAMKSFLLVGLFHIAYIPYNAAKYVDKTMKTFDDQLNDIPGITCRTWLFKVLELFTESSEVDDRPVLRTHDVKGLESEVKRWGNMHAQSAVDNVQPRPIGVTQRYDF